MLRNVDMEVAAGDVLAVVGGNGSGKSTLRGAAGSGASPSRGRRCSGRTAPNPRLRLPGSAAYRPGRRRADRCSWNQR
ncbi:ATP-binding cassette domain-containing protein [Streptomyces sp. SID8455]|nr:ATP-binding cassette domain-containing protein [Streptomyces sp. SID8455]